MTDGSSIGDFLIACIKAQSMEGERGTAVEDSIWRG